MLEEGLKALVTSGPLAILMGVAIVMLWRKNSALLAQAEERGEAHAAKIEGMRLEALTREDNLRTHYESLIDAERSENKTLWRETNEAFKGLIEGV